MDVETIKIPKKMAQSRDSGGFYDYLGPITKHFGPPPVHTKALDARTPTFADGYVYDKRELDYWIINGAWGFETEKAFMNVIDELKNNYDAANELWKQYEGKLAQFRSIVKNDVASLEATAKKAREAGLQIQKVHADLFAQLNSAEMLQAITNAERLGAALKVIQELESSKTTVKMSVSDF